MRNPGRAIFGLMRKRHTFLLFDNAPALHALSANARSAAEDVRSNANLFLLQGAGPTATRWDDSRGRQTDRERGVSNEPVL